jgi:ubiquinol-cytochrome c reductase iron-sulfur subunit
VNRRQTAVAASLLLAALGSLGFMAAYATHAGVQFEGLALTGAAAGFLAAALGWSRWLIPEDRVVDVRDTYPSSPPDRAAAAGALEAGEALVTRNALLNRLLLGALGLFGLAMLFPLRSLGPAPGEALLKTKWRRGVRAVREDGTPVKRSDVGVDSAITVFPEGAVGDAASVAVLVRLPDGVGNSVDGYVAYSKICTHAGCPVALYRAAARQLMCPCHQSIFDVASAGKVLAGPADAPLPELPIDIGRDGYLRAAGDFPVPVGPGFWARGA